MTTHECHGCGNIMSEKEQYCKYCGNVNPDYVAPKVNLFTSSYSSPTPSSGTSQSASKKPNFSVGLFILLLILFWPAAIIYAIAISVARS